MHSTALIVTALSAKRGSAALAVLLVFCIALAILVATVRLGFALLLLRVLASYAKISN